MGFLSWRTRQLRNQLRRRAIDKLSSESANRTAKPRCLMVEALERRALLTTIDLDALVLGTGGTILYGADSGDRSGWSVDSVGDINGDGFDDLVVGAYRSSGIGNAEANAGESYLVFGKSDWSTTGIIDFLNLGSEGVKIFGADVGDRSGGSVAGVGDVNGDGYGDVLISAREADGLGNATANAGESYLIFGRNNWDIYPTIDLGGLGSLGITIYGVSAQDFSGISVAGAGDVNGDGFEDMVIGAHFADGIGNTKSYAGESYLIFGKSTWSFSSGVDLANLGSSGVTIYGADAGDRSGSSVRSGGDLNGDGFDDLLIGAREADSVNDTRSDAGETQILFGRSDWSASPTIDLSTTPVGTARIFGQDAGDRSGRAVSGAGDVNGDGFDDLLIGAYRGDASGNAKLNAGESYLVFGRNNLSNFDLAANAAAGFAVKLFGADSYDYSGRSVGAAGDINGDGFDDLLIGSDGGDGVANSKNLAGESYVVFGKSNWSSTTTIDLATLGASGITILGADSSDGSGRSVNGAGDVNGDGFDDLLIGAPTSSSLANGWPLAGESYLIFGGNSFTNSILPANLGNAAANTIAGTSAANILNGASGFDTLIGNGGADVLLGGQGNDILAVSDLSFRRIVGGNGEDTLRLDGSGLFLNLTAVPDNRLLDIEQIDLTGSGNNRLMLNQREVLNISGFGNYLVVKGNTGDRVAFESGWTAGGIEEIDGLNYRRFTQGLAVLLIQDSVEIVKSIDLANLGPTGVTVLGAEANDRSGFAVSQAGDVNGDGYGDWLIGAPGADALNNTLSAAGESYLIFGKADWTPTPTLDLASLGASGVRILGAVTNGESGSSLSSAGDVNGDGFADLLIGAPRADGSYSLAGQSYVIFGKGNWSATPTINLASLGTAGITIVGAVPNGAMGRSVSGAGDVNGDGFDDFLLAAPSAQTSTYGGISAGNTYLIFGKADWTTTPVINQFNFFSLGIGFAGAEAYDLSGYSVSGAGDVNGDGLADLIIGAIGADALGNSKSSSGESYLIFGNSDLATSPTIDLGNLGSGGVTIFGADILDLSGQVRSAGDVNGDGLDDFVFGARGADSANNLKPDAGESYLIFGKTDWSATPILDLSSLGSNGVKIFGSDSFDYSGSSVASAGDVNGDGFDDLLIGAARGSAFGNSKTEAGETYLIYGKSNWSVTPEIDLANLSSSDGIAFWGATALDRSGHSVSSAGDVNGDGFGDLVIGALYSDPGSPARSGAGSSYLVFGSNDFTNSILAANLGTHSSNTLVGTAAANILNGADGDDTLVGAGGADVLLGGRGNDILAISDLGFGRIVGGTGSDRLRLDASGVTLNLTSIRDNRFRDVEEIDITGSGDNTLILNQREVLNLSSHSNTLTVRRNQGDIVQIGGGWIQQANEVIGGITFLVFVQGAARLNIAVPASVAGSFVYHAGSSFDAPGNIQGALDQGKQLAKEGAVAQQLGFSNLINTTRGINGLVFDINNLPGTVTASDFVFQWSPNGAFFESGNPVSSWQNVTVSPSVSVQGGSPSRVVITWPDQTIVNRWLRVTVLATPNTGLPASEVYYVGHLRGETTGPSAGVFSVSYAQDLSPIRLNLGTNVNAGSTVDIDKNGLIQFADIVAMRSGAAQQLTQITIPALGGGGGGGSLIEENQPQVSDGDTSSSVSLNQLSSTLQCAAYAVAVDSALDDLYSITQRRRGRR